METGFAGDVSVALAIIKVGRKIDNENLTAAELTTCLHRKKKHPIRFQQDKRCSSKKKVISVHLKVNPFTAATAVPWKDYDLYSILKLTEHLMKEQLKSFICRVVTFGFHPQIQTQLSDPNT